MAYTTQDFVGLINKYKDTDPGLAYAIFNGASGMGGGMNTDFSPGAVDIALRNAWGENAAKNWINTTGNTYGNAMFDPTTGQYGYYQDGNIKSGTLAGYDPTQFSKSMSFSGTYAPPGGAGVTAKPYPTGTAAGSTTVPLSSLGGSGGALQPPGSSATPRTTATSVQPGTASPGTTGDGVPGSSSSGTGNNGASTFPIASAAPYTPPASVTTPFDFLNDPGYQFTLGEGKKALENSAAARGMLMSGQTLKDLSNYQTNLANQTYNDAFSRWLQNANFNQNVATDARNYNNANRQWDTSFNNANRIDARNFDFASMKDARDYQTALDQWNQQFQYAVQTGDRQFLAQTLQQLANMGVQSSLGSGSLANNLANTTSSNTLAGAGAGAAGTVGNANTINGILGQLMNYLQSNALLNRILPGSTP